MLRSKLAWTPRHHGLETILRTGMAWERQRLTAPA
jgi:hypothetical protein